MNKIKVELTEDQANFLQAVMEVEFTESSNTQQQRAFANRIRTKLLKELSKS